MHLYVYYRVDERRAAALLAKVKRMQQRLGSQHERSFMLRRRVEVDHTGTKTWMEIYENVPAGFEQILNEAAGGERLQDDIVGERHVERFED